MIGRHKRNGREHAIISQPRLSRQQALKVMLTARPKVDSVTETMLGSAFVSGDKNPKLAWESLVSADKPVRPYRSAREPSFRQSFRVTLKRQSIAQKPKRGSLPPTLFWAMKAICQAPALRLPTGWHLLWAVTDISIP